MRFLIASDLHGSAPCCRQLLAAYERERACRIVFLGDILYHGPRNDLPEGYAPKEVISMLNGISDRIISVRGNCDTEVDQMVLNFPLTAEYIPVISNDRIIFATHGHIYNKENSPFMRKSDIMLYGHTHVPECTEKDGKIYMNPGSLSIPKENSRRSYMTFDGTVFEWKTLEDGKTYMDRVITER